MNIYQISELAALLIENLLMVKFYIDFFSFKKKTPLNYFFALLTFITISIAGTISLQLGMTSDYGIVIALIVMIIFGYFCLEGNLINKIIFSIIAFVVIAVISILTLQILSMLLNVHITTLIDIRGEYRIIVLVMTKVMFYVFGKSILIVTKKQEFQLTIKEWLTCVFIVIMTLIMLTMIYKIMYTVQVSQLSKYLIIIFSMMLILVDVIIYGMVLKLSKSNREEMRYKLMESQIEQQEKMLISVLESNEKIRTLKHDMKNYLMTAIGLIDNKEYSKVKSYMLNLIGQEIDTIETFVTTNSQTLSSLLNIKLDICNKNKINWNVEITSDLTNISDVDISIIIGNLMDNAIEASQKVKNKPFIDLKIFDNKGYVNIIIKNKIENTVLLLNPNLFTTKKDKNSHGIGLMSVKRIVKKYNGMYKVYEENRFLVVNIMLKNM
ncbi:MAG: GHKL domain-containing protein [Lachnospiraceae bacterium]|nr:GHKL domain-containing protein [Lachnospiraceae bacterium]